MLSKLYAEWPGPDGEGRGVTADAAGSSVSRHLAVIGQGQRLSRSYWHQLAPLENPGNPSGRGQLRTEPYAQK